MSWVYSYLDRYFVKHHTLPRLDEVGTDLFRTEIYGHIWKYAVQAIISEVDMDRKGISVLEGGLIKSVAEMYVKMGRYEVDFEKPLLNATEEYFHSLMGG